MYMYCSLFVENYTCMHVHIVTSSSSSSSSSTCTGPQGMALSFWWSGETFPMTRLHGSILGRTVLWEELQRQWRPMRRSGEVVVVVVWTSWFIVRVLCGRLGHWWTPVRRRRRERGDHPRSASLMWGLHHACNWCHVQYIINCTCDFLSILSFPPPSPPPLCIFSSPIFHFFLLCSWSRNMKSSPSTSQRLEGRCIPTSSRDWTGWGFPGLREQTQSLQMRWVWARQSKQLHSCSPLWKRCGHFQSCSHKYA